MRFKIWTSLLLIVSSQPAVAASSGLSCIDVTLPPTIDGDPNDASWAAAPSVKIQDAVVPLEHTLRCVYTTDHIYLLASYPDATENREHKTQIWDKAESRYKTGPKREDTLVLKWSMEPKPVDLSLTSDTPYRADIWYWKSDRTDPVGYADDKYQIYTDQSLPRSKKLISKSGRRFYLVRRGDEGDSTYKSITYANYEADEMPAYNGRKPTGSRADIKANGQWRDGVWHVEFARKRITGNPDDVQFISGRHYQVGISRHEIAGRKRDDDIEAPLFGSGDIKETIELKLDAPTLSVK
jgi:hypothetical protein